jgi:hypothetical protein
MIGLTCLGIGLILLVLVSLVWGASFLVRNNLSKTPVATPSISAPGELPGASPSPATEQPLVSDTPVGPQAVTPGSPAVTQPAVQPSQELAQPTYTPWPTNTLSP